MFFFYECLMNDPIGMIYRLYHLLHHVLLKNVQMHFDQKSKVYRAIDNITLYTFNYYNWILFKIIEQTMYYVFLYGKHVVIFIY